MTASTRRLAPPCAMAGQDPAGHLAVHAGQPPVEAVGALGEALVVNSEKVPDFRVQVVSVDGA